MPPRHIDYNTGSELGPVNTKVVKLGEYRAPPPKENELPQEIQDLLPEEDDPTYEAHVEWVKGILHDIIDKIEENRGKNVIAFPGRNASADPAPTSVQPEPESGASPGDTGAAVDSASGPQASNAFTGQMIPQNLAMLRPPITAPGVYRGSFGNAMLPPSITAAGIGAPWGAGQGFGDAAG